MLNTWKLLVLGTAAQVLPLSVVVNIEVGPFEMAPATKPVFISVNQTSSSSNPALLNFTQLFNVSTSTVDGEEGDELLLLQDK